VPFSEFDVSAEARERGWVLSAHAMPHDAQDINSLRVAVRPHLNRNVLKGLAQDIVAAFKWLEEHGGNIVPPPSFTTPTRSPRASADSDLT